GEQGEQREEPPRDQRRVEGLRGMQPPDEDPGVRVLLDGEHEGAELLELARDVFGRLDVAHSGHPPARDSPPRVAARPAMRIGSRGITCGGYPTGCRCSTVDGRFWWHDLDRDPSLD